MGNGQRLFEEEYVSISGKGRYFNTPFTGVKCQLSDKKSANKNTGYHQIRTLSLLVQLCIVFSILFPSLVWTSPLLFHVHVWRLWSQRMGE